MKELQDNSVDEKEDKHWSRWMQRERRRKNEEDDRIKTVRLTRG